MCPMSHINQYQSCNPGPSLLEVKACGFNSPQPCFFVAFCLLLEALVILVHQGEGPWGLGAGEKNRNREFASLEADPVSSCGLDGAVARSGW